MTRSFKLKRWFKRTLLGRVARHIRNYFWRGALIEEHMKRKDYKLWEATYYNPNKAIGSPFDFD